MPDTAGLGDSVARSMSGSGGFGKRSRWSRRRASLRWAAAAVVSLAAAPAHAHGLGVRYDLPIPLWLYLAGAGVAVALSFAVLALFVRRAEPAREVARITLLRWRPGARPARAVTITTRSAGVVLYLLLIYSGLAGSQTPLKNIAPVAVWAVWWVGMTYVSALAGDVWAAVNPLDTLFRAAEWAFGRVGPGRPLSLGLRYPEALGLWPAVALLLVFVWAELVWEHSDRPASLAAAMLGYTLVTWGGMLVFGRSRWLERGEVFSIVFGLLARFAPLEARARRDGGRELALRPYAVGLLAGTPAPASGVALVLVLLAAVTFDGFMETPPWAALSDHARALAGGAAAWLPTVGLVVAPLVFLAAYAAACRAMLWLSGAGACPARIAGRFVLTLVPIAIAYHLAHYLSFLAAAGQYLVPLASDPFGFGWDLLGTRNAFVRGSGVDARAVWYVSLAAIVVGHVTAVYLAHRLALEEFPDRAAALRSQWPMLGLMVGYTMTSLWIISQPIVTRRPG